MMDYDGVGLMWDFEYFVVDSGFRQNDVGTGRNFSLNPL